MSPILRLDPNGGPAADLSAAVVWLRAAGIVAFPTDTFYGLAVDPYSEQAVHDLFELKGRQARAALPLVAASIAQVEAWCGSQSAANRRLAESFWPGPLSLIFDAPPRVVVAVHGGARTVAIRVPAHPIARAIAEAFGAPVTATSANRSGEAPVTAARGLGAMAGDRRVLVIDAGETPGGVPSTIVDARSVPPKLIREGAVPWNRVLGSLKG